MIRDGGVKCKNTCSKNKEITTNALTNEQGTSKIYASSYTITQYLFF